MVRKHKALVLFSGGLDSMLAVELLRRFGVEVAGIVFHTPFFTAGSAERASRELGLEIRVVDITARHLEVVKQPRFGYGKNLNPCIDCHALMARVAMEHMRDMGAEFLASGEVLGERPMSQNRQALEHVSRLSGAGDLLLRPLSARLLPLTRPEREGWIERDCLLDLRGRSRRRQIELALTWGIGEYESPAGGCLLTDPAFSERLGELMKRVEDFDGTDIELLKVGRHFWVGDTLLVLGRRHAENERLLELALPADKLIKERERPGPTALLRSYPRAGRPARGSVEEAARLLGKYGKGKEPLGMDDIVEVEAPSGEEG